MRVTLLLVAFLTPLAASAATKEPSLRAVARRQLKSGENHQDQVGRYSSSFTPGVPSVSVRRSSVSTFRVVGGKPVFVSARRGTSSATAHTDRAADAGDASLAASYKGTPIKIESALHRISVRGEGDTVHVQRDRYANFLITPAGGVGRLLKDGEHAHDAYKATYGAVDPGGNAWAQALQPRYEAKAATR